MAAETGKARKPQAGRKFSVRSTLAPGDQVVLSAAARGALIRCFGDEALRRAAEARLAREAQGAEGPG